MANLHAYCLYLVGSNTIFILSTLQLVSTLQLWINWRSEFPSKWVWHARFTLSVRRENKENPHCRAFITHSNNTKAASGERVPWVKNEAVYHKVAPFLRSLVLGPFRAPFPMELFIFCSFIFTQVDFTVFVIFLEEDCRSGLEQLLEWPRSCSLIIWLLKNSKFLFIKHTLLNAYHVQSQCQVVLMNIFIKSHQKL